MRGVLGEALAASSGSLAAVAGKAAQQDAKALQVRLGRMRAIPHVLSLCDDGCSYHMGVACVAALALASL